MNEIDDSTNRQLEHTTKSLSKAAAGLGRRDIRVSSELPSERTAGQGSPTRCSAAWPSGSFRLRHATSW